MRRYWLEHNKIQQETNHVLIDGDAFHHIIDVCRQEVGSKFEVLGDGTKAHLVTITSVEKKRAHATILSTRQVPALKKPHLVLALSIPRFHVMDDVVEKCVELGVHRVQPFFSDYSFVRKLNSLPNGKRERWNKIVISATQQSGRGELMQIAEPCEFSELPEIFLQTQSPGPKKRHGLFAFEGESTTSIKQGVATLRNQSSFDDLEEFWIFVGSEGGFSENEVNAFTQWGLPPITLGDQVLRVETACITLLAILKYELGLMEGSQGE